MSLTVTDSSVDKNSITITFSDPVVSDAGTTSATNLANYSIFDPGSADFRQPRTIQDALDDPKNTGNSSFASLASANRTVTITFTPTRPAKNEFASGDWVNVTIKNVKGLKGETLEGDLVAIAPQVQGKSQAARLTRDVEDATSYPVLTEEIGSRISPVGIPTGGGGGGISNLGQVALQAVSDVLGWKPSTTDPKGFVGALTQSFTITDVEGHVESTWKPRSYAVQTDLGGGITGAQASLYMRAKDALDTSLSLLDGLYPLDPEADPEYVKALREMARSQMTEIVKELGAVGLPSILRIDTYFGILVGQSPAGTNSTPVQFDPDAIGGTLGQLRDTYGIYFRGNPFNNSVGDEQDITNFRVISDYMTSLMQSWIANRDFFRLGTKHPAFFGTQLVLLSRQFNVIAETVNEVRFTLDSVFIGANERQTLVLEFADETSLPSMFLEDVLVEVEKFVTDEGPRLLRDGGKISVTNNILPVVESLQNMVEQAHDPENLNELPRGFRTARVQNALADLQDQLQKLFELTEQVEQKVPLVENKPTITGISPLTLVKENHVFSIFGDGFDRAVEVSIHSSVLGGVRATVEQFYSAQRIDVAILKKDWDNLALSSHDVTVTNPNDESATLTNAFTKRRGDHLTPSGTGGGSPVTAAASTPAATSTPAPEVAALQSQMNELQKSNEALTKKVDTLLKQMADYFKGKSAA
jgi:hypothetical protein